MAKCDKKHAPSWLHAKKHMKKFRSKIKTTSMSGPHPRIFNNGNNHNKTWEVSRSNMAQSSRSLVNDIKTFIQNLVLKIHWVCKLSIFDMDDCENILIGECSKALRRKSPITTIQLATVKPYGSLGLLQARFLNHSKSCGWSFQIR